MQAIANIEGKSETNALVATPARRRPSQSTESSLGWLRQSWHRIFHQSLPLEVEIGLLSAYKEPQRHYHRLAHINDCIAKLVKYRHLFSEFDVAVIAMWFHDVVYNPRRTDNEEKSVEYFNNSARMAFARNCLAESQEQHMLRAQAQVAHLILLTKHHASAASLDGQAFIDIDLSILAASSKRFTQYEHQIRAEYIHFSDPDYALGRGRFLLELIARPTIFHHPALKAAWEHKARRNITTSCHQRMQPQNLEKP